jgi:lysylphosphatidylglycerol synthetase-like protein (DUF2156 family)
MEEHQVFFSEIFGLTAYLGAPVFLLGAAIQSWLLLRRSSLGRIPALITVLLSTLVAILLAIAIWVSPWISQLDLKDFMLLEAISLPALLSTLIIVPAVTFVVLALSKRASSRNEAR